MDGLQKSRAVRSPQPNTGSHHVSGDDIELPPQPDTLPKTPAAGQPGSLPSSRRSTSGMKGIVITAGLLASLALGGWWLQSSNSKEEGHPNWQHVAAATEASASQDREVLMHVDPAGTARVVPAIELSSIDIDRDTSRAVQEALCRQDLAAAKNALQTAQEPSAADVVDLAANPQLASAIEDESQQFYNLFVFDCCDEDGDVVQILVNGEPFVTVPITHEGAHVSVPLARGNNTIALRGIRDGTGGITVSFRTGRGEYFSSRMREGEEHQLGVVVR